MGGFAAGIHENQNVEAKGVVYSIPGDDKIKLDSLESIGYYPVNKRVKMDNTQELLEVVYIPNDTRQLNLTTGKPKKSYLNVMIEGANENGLTTLEAYLRTIQTID